MTFRNSILAGMTLIREAIQSQNYEPGQAGWKIASDGTAEFADLTIRSSDGQGGTVVIENGRAVFTAPSGWQIIIDPTLDLPVIFFNDPDGNTAGALNSVQHDGEGVVLSSGRLPNATADDWRWENFLGHNGDDEWFVRKVRESDPDTNQGAVLFANDDLAQVGLASTGVPDPTAFTVMDHLAQLSGGSLAVTPSVSGFPAVFVDIEDDRFTDSLMHFQVDGVGVADIDQAGNIASAGYLDVADTPWTTFTPNITGGGAATFTIHTGYYYKLGKLVFVHAYFVVGTAGTGSTALTLTVPSAPFRSTQRQSIPGQIGGAATATNGPCGALSFAGGSGANFDRITLASGANAVGTSLATGSIWTFDGWYREA